MHYRGAPLTVFHFGPFTLDGRSGELRKGPTRLRVPDQSIAILRELVQSPGELVTREALRDRLWPPDTHVDFDAGLNAAVRRLREALGDSADAPRYVETVPRRGYRFIAAVDGLPAAAALAPAASAGGDVSVVARPEGARGPQVRNVTLVVMALALLAAGAWVALRRNDAAPPASVAKPVPITSFPGLEINPAISPAGNLVAFAWGGERGDNFDIYVRSLDGRSQVQLTSDAAPDHLPAWSPDGQRIAFVRVLSGRRVMMEVPALGGPEQALCEAGPPEREALAFGGAAGGSYGLSWTPDGRHLLFGDRNASAFAAAIHQYSLEDGQRRQLTSPPANLSDGRPIVSPDGRYLAFVRRNDAHFGGSVFVQKFDSLHAGGEPVQLTYGHLVRTFDWTADSSSIIHDSWWENGLWRTGVGGGRSEPVLPHILALSPSVARSGSGVVYQSSSIDSNIWELPRPPSPTLEPSGDATFRVIASTSIDQDPQFSPDGARIAFASARSGHRQLWVANRDGSGSRPLTSFADGRVGSPSWSADGQWIAFDAIRSNAWNLCIVPANGGIISTLIADDAFNNVRPSWSLDGRWIYFGSDRTGSWQIWKVPSAGGTPERVTRGGGIEPVVSPDGRRVYYAKPPPEQGIWEIPAEGGDEVRIVDRGRALSFDVADTGIFMLDVSTKPQATVEMFSFSSRQLTTVARLPPGLRFSSAPYLRVTRDGTSLLYVPFDQWHSDIHMLPGFR